MKEQKSKLLNGGKYYPVEITYGVDVGGEVGDGEDYEEIAEEGVGRLTDELGNWLGEIKEIKDEGYGYHERIFSVDCVIYVEADNGEEAKRIAFEEQEMLAGFGIRNEDGDMIHA